MSSYIDMMTRICDNLDRTLAEGVRMTDAMAQTTAILRPYAASTADELYGLVDWPALARTLEDWLTDFIAARPHLADPRVLGTWWLCIVLPMGEGLDIELDATVNRFAACMDESSSEEIKYVRHEGGRSLRGHFAPLREFGLRVEDLEDCEGTNEFLDGVALTEWALPLVFLLHGLVELWPRVEQRVGLTLAGPADVGAAWSQGDSYCLTNHIIAERKRQQR